MYVYASILSVCFARFGSFQISVLLNALFVRLMNHRKELLGCLDLTSDVFLCFLILKILCLSLWT